MHLHVYKYSVSLATYHPHLKNSLLDKSSQAGFLKDHVATRVQRIKEFIPYLSHICIYFIFK